MNRPDRWAIIKKLDTDGDAAEAAGNEVRATRLRDGAAYFLTDLLNASWPYGEEVFDGDIDAERLPEDCREPRPVLDPADTYAVAIGRRS